VDSPILFRQILPGTDLQRFLRRVTLRPGHSDRFKQRLGNLFKGFNRIQAQRKKERIQAKIAAAAAEGVPIKTIRADGKYYLFFFNFSFFTKFFYFFLVSDEAKEPMSVILMKKLCNWFLCLM
jgi:hypothetical protein